MRRRIEAIVAAIPGRRVRPCAALRQALADGYGLRSLQRDLLAGLVVGIVALPLSMALAIASGVPPQHGLYTAIVAGAVIAALGGSRVQVSGPTAAFVVILAPISAEFGLAGLAIASVGAGIMLMLMGLLRLGRLIEFIPYPVTTGFTAGIAVVIATLQVKDLLGLTIDTMPDHYINKVAAIVVALPTVNWPDVAIGAGTLLILLAWPRLVRRVPAPLVALPAAAAAAWIISLTAPDVQIATINSRFTYMDGEEVRHGIPPMPPMPVLPWNISDPAGPVHAPAAPDTGAETGGGTGGVTGGRGDIGGGAGGGGPALPFSFELAESLLIAAFAIAMLGAIESLLSAVVADGMTGFTHDPNAELFAQGVGNIVAPFFGGFAATGAIARTATNIRTGGRSPVAAIVHAAFILAAVLALAPLLGFLPMAALAAQLLIVARNMAEVKHFSYVMRIGPRSDVAVLMACFTLTVVFDMVVAVSVGVVLAAVLFMRRMAEVSGVTLIGSTHPQLTEPLPPGVLLYEIAGPLFFGAAQKAMSALHSIGNGVKVVILDMESVPTMDATGLVNLQSTIRRLHSDRILIILGGVRDQPREVLERANLEELDSRIGICPTIEEAIALARFHVALGDDLHPPVSVAAKPPH